MAPAPASALPLTIRGRRCLIGEVDREETDLTPVTGGQKTGPTPVTGTPT